MSAYVIGQVRFLPGPELAQYRERAVPAIAQYGGRFVVRGKEKVLLEGQDNGLNSIIVIEFDSLEQARRWYASPEYAQALALGPRAMVREMFIVEGS
jgi:uncharacterized protein (DUF1330 family)